MPPYLKALAPHDVVWIGGTKSPNTQSSQAGTFCLAELDTTEQSWRFKTRDTNMATHLRLQHTDPQLSLNPELGTEVRVLSLTTTVTDHDSHTSTWKHIALDPRHQRPGTSDSILGIFADLGHNPGTYPIPPLVITPGRPTATGLDLLAALIFHQPLLATSLNTHKSTVASRCADLVSRGGNDGQRPAAEDYHGRKDESKKMATALRAFETIEDIAIVAAPGSTFGMKRTYRDNAVAIADALIAHAEHMRYRFAVLDSGEEQSIEEVLALRTLLSSSYAALYYPWVRSHDPVTDSDKLFPPSGFVTGIFVRTDNVGGAHNAPTNEVTVGAIGLETLLNQDQQNTLNPGGINCLRFLKDEESDFGEHVRSVPIRNGSTSMFAAI